jgi:hypothetical protein
MTHKAIHSTSSCEMERKRDLWRWPKGSIHRQLAALSQQAHEATAARDTAQVREIEAEIDRLAAELWRLTEEELREIQESLEELG